MAKSKNGPGHVVIRASAGTGKTHQLAVRFIALLAGGARPDEILATTFTRKAAGEILDRVLFRLAKAAADEKERKRLAQDIGDEGLTSARCRQLLLTTLRQLHALRVGTLDSYFLQVATSFGQELGLPPGWSICEEQIDELLRDEAIELLLSRGRLADLLTLVHALTKGEAARSVARLARDTITSLLELYREAVPEAWGKLVAGKGLEEAEQEELLSAIAALGLEDKRMATARDEDLNRFRAGDWEGFIGTGLASKVLSGDCVFYKKPLPKGLVKLYEQLLKHVASILVGQVARQMEATQQLLTRFDEHYQVLQLEERALRFSDVTFRLAKGAARVDLERMAFRLDGGVKHLLLDEFQDTSPAQWRVLRPLAERLTRGEGSFFCVGDVKQAIYGWRGGVAAIFDALEGQLSGLKSELLSTSYRSAAAVMETANVVFKNLGQHPNLDKLAPPVQKWQEDFPEHTTTRTDLAGYVTLHVAPAAAEEAEQPLETFRYAAERVHHYLQEKPGASIGVLVRTNTAVARLIYELRDLGVAASEEGGNPLIDSPAVELVLSLLRLADHPGDSVARFHVAHSPLGAFVEFSDYQDDAAASRLGQQIRRQLLEVGYGPTVYAHAQQLAFVCEERDRSRLQQLVELAYEFQPASTLRTRDFVRLVSKRRIADPRAAEVRVMTIHQAKGLEFDVVFLPELESRLIGQPDRFVAGRPGPTDPVNVVCRLADKTVRQFFPPELQKLFDDDMCLEVSEALCLLYVAMTRPVHALHMIIAPAKTNERTMPKTFAGILRATLANGKPARGRELLYEHGDAKWQKPRSANEDQRERGSSDQRINPAKVQLAPALEHRQRGWERVSPSGLEGGVKLAGAQILAAKSSLALGIGTLFHAWLAEIGWLDEERPSDDVLRRVAMRLRAESGMSDERLADHIARFKKQIAAKSVAEVLSRKYYDTPANWGPNVKVWPGSVEISALRERAFALSRHEQLLTGSMDRLVIVRSDGKAIGADVVDFKTDEVDAGDHKMIVERVDFYRPQMESYRSAAADLLHINVEKVTARLVFLSAGVVQAV